MSAVWRWISLRHLFHEGGRTLLTLAGVALGVAVFVSVRIANHSAMASFAETVDAVAGKANLQVTSDTSGFDERIYPSIRALPGVAAAAPVVQVYARAAFSRAPVARAYTHGQKQPYDETLLVLGIDPFSEAPFGRYQAPARTEPLAALSFIVDPHAVAITRALAERRHLRRGDPLRLIAGGRPVTLHVRQVLDSRELEQAMGGSVLL